MSDCLLTCVKEQTFYVITKGGGFLTSQGCKTEDIEYAERFSSEDRALFVKGSLRNPKSFDIKKINSEFWMED